MNSDFLFVYGTLLTEIDSRMAAFLRSNSKRLGVGFFEGRLFDLGSYPGAVYQKESSDRVYGQVFEIQDPAATFRILDHYEGISTAETFVQGYVRKKIPIHYNNQLIDCWVYLYQGSTDQLPVISSGNYLLYLQQGNDRHWQFIKSN